MRNIRYFLIRRAYGGEHRRQWFSWVYFATNGDQWQEAGDPFPVRTPTQQEIRSAIGERLKIPPESILLERKR